MNTSLIELQQSTVKQLHQIYAGLFGKSTSTRNKPWLIKKIASAAEKKQEKEKEVATNPAKQTDDTEQQALCKAVAALGLPIGTEIAKRYKGTYLIVTIQSDGFELNGVTYTSLSAAAKAVAGCNWNGHVFFGLKKRPTTNGKKDQA